MEIGRKLSGRLEGGKETVSEERRLGYLPTDTDCISGNLAKVGPEIEFPLVIL